MCVVAFFSAVFSVVSMFFAGLTIRVFLFIVHIYEDVFLKPVFQQQKKIIILVGTMSTRGEPSLRLKKSSGRSKKNDCKIRI